MNKRGLGCGCWGSSGFLLISCLSWPSPRPLLVSVVIPDHWHVRNAGGVRNTAQTDYSPANSAPHPSRGSELLHQPGHVMQIPEL